MLLRLRAQADDVVTYALELTWRSDVAPALGEVRVAHGSGEVSFSFENGNAPEWLVEATRAVLRTLWRARRRDVAEPEPWPRRIKRWRLSPERRGRDA